MPGEGGLDVVGDLSDVCVFHANASCSVAKLLEVGFEIELSPCVFR